MLWVTIGKVNLLGNRISPNLLCRVTYSNTTIQSRHHPNCSHADINETFKFPHDNSEWLRIELCSDSTIMCSVEENIRSAQEGVRNVVRMKGDSRYCNSGLVEYTVGRKARNVFDASAEESKSQQEEEEYTEQEGSSQYQQSSTPQTPQPREQNLRPPAGNHFTSSQHSLLHSANFSLQQHVRLSHIKVNKLALSHSNGATTDQEGMRFIGGIDQMLGDGKEGGFEEGSKEGSRIISDQQMKFVPTASQRNDLTFGEKGRQITESQEKGEQEKREIRPKYLERDLGDIGKKGKQFVDKDQKAQVSPSKDSKNFNSKRQPNQPQDRSQENKLTNNSPKNHSPKARSNVPIIITKNKDSKSPNQIQKIPLNDLITSQNSEFQPDKKQNAYSSFETIELKAEDINIKSSKQPTNPQVSLERSLKNEIKTKSPPKQVVNSKSPKKQDPNSQDSSQRSIDRPQKQQFPSVLQDQSNQELGQQQLGKKYFGKARKSSYIHRQKKNLRRKFQIKDKYTTENDQSCEMDYGLVTQSPYDTGNEAVGKVCNYLQSSYLSDKKPPLNSLSPKTPFRRKLKDPSNPSNPFFSSNPTTTTSTSKLLLFSLSCNPRTTTKNLRNRISLQLLKDNTKYKCTSLCPNKYPPYEWPDYFQVDQFEELKFNLRYYQPQIEASGHQESEELEREKTRIVTIGTAVLRRSEIGQEMAFRLPMEFRGLKMGELSFKVNYRLGGMEGERERRQDSKVGEQSHQEKGNQTLPSKNEGPSSILKPQKVQTVVQKVEAEAQTNRPEKTFQSISIEAKIPSPILKSQTAGNLQKHPPQLLISNEQNTMDFKDQQMVNLTSTQQKSIIQGLRNLQTQPKPLPKSQPQQFQPSTPSTNPITHSNFLSPFPSPPHKPSQVPLSSSLDTLPPLSPIKLVYPRARAGFITNLTSVSIAQLYNRHPQIPESPSRQLAPQPQLSPSPSQIKSTITTTSTLPEILSFNTIIFKNFNLASPPQLTFLVITHNTTSLQTEKIHGKDIFWTKQVLNGVFSHEEEIRFAVYEKEEDGRVLVGEGALPIADIKSKHKMYSYKLPIFRERGVVVGELLLNYEFKRGGGGKEEIRRERVMSFSIENQRRSLVEEEGRKFRENSVYQRFHSRQLFDPVASRSNSIKKKLRQPHYYTGNNVKFGQAPRFRTEPAEAPPGPGSYCLPSVFDRHKAIQ